jgi:hypothetical protein
MKENFKKKVLDWIKSEGVDIGDKRVRVYDYRGDIEVRIYNEPMELTNNRRSFRETSREETPTGFIRHGTTGIHSRKISTYVHINSKDFETPDEKSFIIECLKA